MASTINEFYTFIALYDCVGETTDEKEEPEVIKEDVECEYTVYLDSINSVRTVTDKVGEIKVDRCALYIRDEGLVVVKGSKNDITEIIFGKPKKKQIGYSKDKTNE